jgi:hypothetical protein
MKTKEVKDDDLDEEYIKTNRETSLFAKLGYHWCNVCDANLVGKLGRCLVCKNKSSNKKK